MSETDKTIALDDKYRHLKEECVAYQEGGMGCQDCYCDSSCKDDACHICGGNAPGRIDDQIEWLEEAVVSETKDRRTRLTREKFLALVEDGQRFRKAFEEQQRASRIITAEDWATRCRRAVGGSDE